MMKNTPKILTNAITALAAFCFLALSLGPATAFAESNLDFTLVNDTGWVIKHVFVSPTKADDWQEDILGQDTLPNGKSVEIKFHRAAEKTTKWDIKIVFDDGEYRYWTNLDLSTISEVTLHYKDDHATATWK